MTALLHFEDKVHRKGLARAEGLPLLMPRLLRQVLEHSGGGGGGGGGGGLIFSHISKSPPP